MILKLIAQNIIIELYGMGSIDKNCNVLKGRSMV